MIRSDDVACTLIPTVRRFLFRNSSSKDFADLFGQSHQRSGYRLFTHAESRNRNRRRNTHDRRSHSSILRVEKILQNLEQVHVSLSPIGQSDSPIERGVSGLRIPQRTRRKIAFLRENDLRGTSAVIRNN